MSEALPRRRGVWIQKKCHRRYTTCRTIQYYSELSIEAIGVLSRKFWNTFPAMSALTRFTAVSTFHAQYHSTATRSSRERSEAYSFHKLGTPLALSRKDNSIKSNRCMSGYLLGGSSQIQQTKQPHDSGVFASRSLLHTQHLAKHHRMCIHTEYWMPTLLDLIHHRGDACVKLQLCEARLGRYDGYCHQPQ